MDDHDRLRSSDNDSASHDIFVNLSTSNKYCTSQRLLYVTTDTQILTCQFLALCMNPVMATATLDHLAIRLVIFVALITEKTEVS